MVPFEGVSVASNNPQNDTVDFVRVADENKAIDRYQVRYKEIIYFFMQEEDLINFLKNELAEAVVNCVVNQTGVRLLAKVFVLDLVGAVDLVTYAALDNLLDEREVVAEAVHFFFH